ncbi:MAG: metallophosphoesterase [Jatrophihabitans sp.]
MSGVGRWAARAVVAAAGASAGLRLASDTSRQIGPLTVRADLDLARDGGVQISLPLGTAHLQTHRGPLRVNARVVGVDPARADSVLADPALDAVLTAAGKDAKALAAALAARGIAAALGGAAALAALTWRRPRDVAGSTGWAAAGLATIGALAAATADKDAWRDPELTGLLSKAPLLLGDLQQAPGRLTTYRDQLAELVRTATAVHAAVMRLPEAPPHDAIRLVHISDVHLSPLGLPLARVLVEQYAADAVIDTGDLVDWGTPAEDAFADQIAGLGVPYLYVKGNHDSDGTARAVARQRNAVVFGLDSEPAEVVGLRFAGMPDPRFTPDKTTGDDHAHHRVGEAGAEFAERIRGRAVDIALVHAPAAGRPLAGLVPLVLAGDIHRRDVRRYGDTTVLVQGTSGGSGLRGVQADPPSPLALSVLFIDRLSRRLWGVDEVTLGGIGSTDVSVVRRTAAELGAG